MSKRMELNGGDNSSSITQVINDIVYENVKKNSYLHSSPNSYKVSSLHTNFFIFFAFNLIRLLIRRVNASKIKNDN